MQDLIKRHDEGEDILMEKAASAPEANVSDLMEALQTILDANRERAEASTKGTSRTAAGDGGGRDTRRSSRRRRVKAAAKKTRAGKTARAS